MTLKNDALVIAGVALAGLFIAWYVKKKVEDAGAAVAEAVDVAWEGAKEAASQGLIIVDRSAAWPILKAGDAIGIPRTNMNECEKALSEGRTWDASFACPAGDFIGSFF